MQDELSTSARLSKAIVATREAGRHRRAGVPDPEQAPEWVTGSNAHEMGFVITHLAQGNDDEAPLQIAVPLGATTPLPMRRGAQRTM